MGRRTNKGMRKEVHGLFYDPYRTQKQIARLNHRLFGDRNAKEKNHSPKEWEKGLVRAETDEKDGIK
jgi:hypothetical protein